MVDVQEHRARLKLGLKLEAQYFKRIFYEQKGHFKKQKGHFLVIAAGSCRSTCSPTVLLFPTSLQENFKKK